MGDATIRPATAPIAKTKSGAFLIEDLKPEQVFSPEDGTENTTTHENDRRVLQERNRSPFRYRHWNANAAEFRQCDSSAERCPPFS
jgi:hypothetical protein